MQRTIKIYLIFFFCLIVSHLQAQKKNDILKNHFISNPIRVDGELADWPDSLNYYHAASKLHYNAGNDNTNLYIALKTSDPAVIRKILSFGFTFGVSPDNRKKGGTSVTFPVVDRIALRSSEEERRRRKEPADVNSLNQQILSKVYGLNIEGFKILPDGSIALNNDFGISAAGALSDSGVFTYELAIPLKLLEIEPQDDKTITYSFKVNGLQRTVIEQGLPTMGRYGMYGYGYGGYGYGRSEPYRRTISETVEFRVKFNLAHQ